MGYGEIIKKKRLENNLSLDDIFLMIRIRKSYIVAFEEEDYSAMPEEPFSFGFFKSYLSCLGIKDLSLLDEYKEKRKKFSDSSSKKYDSSEKSFKKDLLENLKMEPKNKKSKINYTQNNIFIIILAIILAVTLIYIKYLTKKVEKMNFNFKKINNDLLIKKEYKHIFELTMFTPEQSWVVVKSDQKVLLNGLLKKDTKNIWLSFNGFEISIGNKQNLEIKLNNKKLNISNYKSGEKIIINEDSLLKEEVFL